MSSKSVLYNKLKEVDFPFDRHYRDYTADELASLCEQFGIDVGETIAAEAAPTQPIPQQQAGMNAYAQRGHKDIVRVDDEGRRWVQDEVLKPAFARPRARRKLTYIDSGTRTTTIQDGQYVETVEVAGNQHREESVKITMPTFQVGLYYDPRYPFLIHTYNEQLGFDLFEVQEFYGGAELVPPAVKRIYIANDLCYDMRSVINEIQAEFRRLQLKGN